MGNDLDREAAEHEAICNAAEKARPEPWWVVEYESVHGVDYGDPHDPSEAYDLLEDPPLEVLRLLVLARSALLLWIERWREERREKEVAQRMANEAIDANALLGDALQELRAKASLEENTNG